MHPKLQTLRSGGGTFIPASAFDPTGVFTRSVTTSGASGFIGTKVVQQGGIIGWSSVAKNATILGPFKAADVSVWIDTQLPSAQWLPEIGLCVPADPNFQAVVLSPKRVSGKFSLAANCSFKALVR